MTSPYVYINQTCNFQLHLYIIHIVINYNHLWILWPHLQVSLGPSPFVINVAQWHDKCPWDLTYANKVHEEEKNYTLDINRQISNWAVSPCAFQRACKITFGLYDYNPRHN